MLSEWQDMQQKPNTNLRDILKNKKAKTLNIIRNQIDVVDTDTKWAALELMLSSSASIIALAKKMAKPETKTITRTTSIPKTKVIKQPVQQPSKPVANDAARTAINPIIPQEPLSNQQRN